MLAQWNAFATKENAKLMLGIVAVAVIVQVIPGAGEVFDGAMVGLFLVTAGPAAFEGGQELGRFLLAITGVATEKDVDSAAEHLAQAVTLLGVVTVLTWLQQRAVRGSGRGGAAAEEPAISSKSASPTQRMSKGTAPEVTGPSVAKPAAEVPVQAPKFLKPAMPKNVLEPGAIPGPVSPAINPMPEIPEGFPKISQTDVNTFANTPEPQVLPEGTKLYRVVGDGNNPAGSSWTRELPATESDWRSAEAVKGEWNGDGGYVEYTVPKGGLPAWTGEAAPQPAALPGYILKGGGDQVWIPPNSIAPSAPLPTPWSVE
jgi:hypothetical protein